MVPLLTDPRPGYQPRLQPQTGRVFSGAQAAGIRDPTAEPTWLDARQETNKGATSMEEGRRYLKVAEKACALTNLDADEQQDALHRVLGMLDAEEPLDQLYEIAEAIGHRAAHQAYHSGDFESYFDGEEDSDELGQELWESTYLPVMEAIYEAQDADVRENLPRHDDLMDQLYDVYADMWRETAELFVGEADDDEEWSEDEDDDEE